MVHRARDSSKRKTVNEYMVLYYVATVMNPLNQPFGYYCMANSAEEAEELCRNNRPRCGIVWVHCSSSYDAALEEFRSSQFTWK